MNKFKWQLMFMCALVPVIGMVLAGCKSMQVDYLEQESVSGPSHVRQFYPINPREITVWAMYKDGKRRVYSVSPSEISFDSSRPGTQTVRIRGAFNRQEVSFQTEVVALNGLTITSPPRNTLFKIGTDPDPRWPGLEIRGTWAQLGSEQIPIDRCEVTGYLKNQSGRQTITVAFGGLRTTFEVNVRSMSGIQIINPPRKTDYYQGETLDLAGLRVMGLWGDGIPDEELTITRADVTGFNSNNRGIQRLTITKNERTVNFSVEVWGLVSLDLEKPPTKTIYVVGEQLDLRGILIKGTYMGSTDTRREGDGYIAVDRLRFNGYDPNRVGKQQRITVWVEGLNAIYVNIFVDVDPAPAVTGITVTPANQSLERGRSLQFSASVTGSGNPSQAVTWRVSSNAAGTGSPASGTGINSSGLLTISPNETAETLYVFAASAVNTAISASTAVNVIRNDTNQNQGGQSQPGSNQNRPGQNQPGSNQPGANQNRPGQNQPGSGSNQNQNQPPASTGRITISPANPTVAVGSPLDLTATVTGLSNNNVIWTVGSNPDGTGRTGNGTSINNNGKLSISANETASVLYVKATSRADSSVYAIIAVTVIQR